MRIRLLPCILIALLLLPFGAAIAAQGNGGRLALVIGNAKYPDSETPLKEPINDARALADELKRDGFDVDIGENLTGQAMRRAVDRLYGKIKPDSVVLVFFSGYGIQSGRQSYMIPVDAQIWTEADVRRDGLSLETILGEINSRGAGVKIALLDASRRNPFERRFRNFSAGLAPVIAPSGTVVMYSAALSSVVSEGGGDRSLFISELLKEIRVPGLTAEETLNRTRVGVTRASRGEQVPWLSSSLAEEFSFSAGGPAQAIAATAPTPPATPAPPQAATPAEPAKSAEAAKPEPAVQAPLPAAEAPKTTEAPKPAETPKPVADAPKPAEAPKPAADAKAAEPPSPPPVVAALPSKQETAPPSQPEKPSPAALANDPTIKALSERLASRPGDQNTYYKRGQVYASKGAYELAIKDFNEAIRLNPRDVEAFNNRCWTRAVIGDLQPALKDCNEALRLRPGFVDALDSRGLVHLKTGNHKNAIADFDAALKINPRLTSSLYGRGIARERSGAAESGARDVANAKAMDPDIVKEFAGYGVK